MSRLFAGTQWDRPPRCERCGALEEECQCPPPSPTYASPASQTARVSVEKRKAGRRVTTIRGLAATDNDLATLLTQLKNHCGAGGTLKEDHLEIQGDHAAKACELLQEIGYRTKTSR